MFLEEEKKRDCDLEPNFDYPQALAGSYQTLTTSENNAVTIHKIQKSTIAGDVKGPICRELETRSTFSHANQGARPWKRVQLVEAWDRRRYWCES